MAAAAATIRTVAVSVFRMIMLRAAIRSVPKNVGSMKWVRLSAMFFLENGHKAVMPPVVETSRRR